MRQGESAIDLSAAEVVDNHCHPFRNEERLSLDPSSWETRLTMMGMCLASSGETDPVLARQVQALHDSTVFALVARRWLAQYLGVPATSSELAAARQERYAADPVAYVNGLLADQNIAGLIADEGYPQPSIRREEFEQNVGVRVWRVARIEPWILELQGHDLGFDDFVAAFEHLLDQAAQDPHLVGYKSVIAYRTGLDVTAPSSAEARRAYERWRQAGWPPGRGPGKVVRDHLLRTTLQAARRHERVVHLHCGGGDPDIVLAHARPQDVFDLLHDHLAQPIVLIHAGWPWLAEAAYIASILPFVYLDLSEFLPWASTGIDRELEILLGVAPTGKLLYGSDEASEPEVLWLGARLAREALERVLSRAVHRDHLTAAEAARIGRGVLADNSRRLHGIE